MFGATGKITDYNDPPSVLMGSVVGPSMIASVIQNINRWLDGMNSFAGLIVDGVGGALASARSADTPLAMFKDMAGNLRWLLDHNGYPTGRRCELAIDWTGVAADSRLSSVATNTASATAAYPSVCAYKDGGTATNTPWVIASWGIAHTGFAGLSLVAEMEVSFDSISQTNTLLFAGVQDNTVGGFQAATNLIGFERLAGGTNWQAVVTGASNVDLGAAPIVGTSPTQRLRLEIHGSASPYGSGANGKVRFWINETLKAEVVATIPSFAAVLAIGSAAQGSAPGAATRTYTGPIRVNWNRLLSMPAL